MTVRTDFVDHAGMQADAAYLNQIGTEINANTTAIATFDADDVTADGTTYKRYSATEKTKLAGIASGATANDTDANLKARANHTGTQTSSTISDFTEAVQDAVGALLSGTTGVTVNYNDAGNTLTISGLGDASATAETIRDTIGIAMAGVGLISVTPNDALDTITISTTATANDTDANLKARANHTGTQSADTLTDGTTNKAFLATERTKLSGVATGATANSSDATLLARANHTGTQSADTVVDGTTNKAYTATEKTKLAGIASGATVNDTSAMVSGSNNGSATALTLWKGTAAQYAALGSGRPSTTVYIVTP